VDDIGQVLLRFNRLMRDVENGMTTRNSFYPWEIELLVDLQDCDLGPNRRRLLRRYQKAFARALEHGTPTLLKLSEYLARTRVKSPRASAA
jgi:hypothetical protein